MKTASVIAIVAAAVAIGFGVYMVDIDQTEQASMPDVDLSIEGGNMPEFDAEVGAIQTGTEEITMEVPTVDLVTPEDNNDS